MNHLPQMKKSNQDCETCVDFKDWFDQNKTKKDANAPSDTKQLAADEKSVNLERPLFRNEYGRVAWSYLHTMAAYYPNKPSKEQQTNMSEFIRTFTEFFPCKECAEDFKDEIQKSPPRLDNRKELSEWFCEQHNIVNRKLGKNEFDCARVLERWRLNLKKKN